MEGLLFAILSLLVLFLVLYFLPLGLTVKGKVLVAVIAFLIGTIGFLLESILPLWQIGILLLVFVGVTTYLVSKREVDWLFQPEEESTDKGVEEDKILGLETDGAYNHIARSDKMSNSEEVLSEKQNSDNNNLSKKLNQQNGDNTYIEKALDEHDLSEVETLAEESDLPASRNSDDQVLDEELRPNKDLVVNDDEDIEALLKEAKTSLQNGANQQNKSEESLDYLAEFEDIFEEKASVSQKTDSVADIPAVTGDGFDLDELVLEPIVVKEEEPIIPPPVTDENDDFEIEIMEFIEKAKEKEEANTEGQQDRETDKEKDATKTEGAN